MQSTDYRRKILLTFRHGLGDAVQLTTVLLHLQQLRPEWQVDAASLVGKHTAFDELVQHSFVLDREPIHRSKYHAVYSLDWPECHNGYSDSPSTKAELCLREIFKLKPRVDLCRYHVQINGDSRNAAIDYIRSIGAKLLPDGRYNVLVLHYQGNTSQHYKDLSHDAVKTVCDFVISAGFVPVILDWDRRSPLPDGRTIFCPDVKHHMWKNAGTGDAQKIAAIIDASSLFIGIDSGPQKVAGATRTPTIAVWVRHHPIHYYGLAENVLHFCPKNADELIRGDQKSAKDFFLQHYRHRTYTDLTRGLLELLQERIGAHVPRDGDLISIGKFWIRSDNISQDLVIVQDIYENDAYRISLHPVMIHSAEVIVDIGAHIGCFARLCHERNPQAKIICVEACPENLDALRANVGHFAEIVHAACTYESEPIALLNSVWPNCESTGSSVVVPVSELRDSRGKQEGYRYRYDSRPLPKITLEELMDRFGVDYIDLLKLDCEGSELSILGETSSIERIRFIVGEYHNRTKWDQLRARRFSTWNYGHMLETGDSGIFHLCNPRPPLPHH
jgi:FkbM family methyltransferase